MAGASLNIDYRIDARGVTDVLNRLTQAGTDLELVFEDIGKYLEQSHTQRFDDQQAPDGTPWKPLNRRYQARKKKNPGLILVLEGYLGDTLSYEASPDSLAFGSNLPYAATHQFGDESRGIPARPFLGLSGDDEVEIMQILREHLAEVAG